MGNCHCCEYWDFFNGHPWTLCWEWMSRSSAVAMVSASEFLILEGEIPGKWHYLLDNWKLHEETVTHGKYWTARSQCAGCLHGGITSQTQSTTLWICDHSGSVSSRGWPCAGIAPKAAFSVARTVRNLVHVSSVPMACVAKEPVTRTLGAPWLSTDQRREAHAEWRGMQSTGKSHGKRFWGWWPGPCRSAECDSIMVATEGPPHIASPQHGRSQRRPAECWCRCTWKHPARPRLTTGQSLPQDTGARSVEIEVGEASELPATQSLAEAQHSWGWTSTTVKTKVWLPRWTSTSCKQNTSTYICNPQANMHHNTGRPACGLRAWGRWGAGRGSPPRLERQKATAR